jgi:hypothetical protein
MFCLMMVELERWTMPGATYHHLEESLLPIRNLSFVCLCEWETHFVFGGLCIWGFACYSSCCYLKQYWFNTSPCTYCVNSADYLISQAPTCMAKIVALIIRLIKTMRQCIQRQHVSINLRYYYLTNIKPQYKILCNTISIIGY